MGIQMWNLKVLIFHNLVYQININAHNRTYNFPTNILAWKFRELQRLKRDRELREAEEAEQAERDRRRAMTEEQRIEDLKLNPRIITNKALDFDRLFIFRII